MEYRTQWRRSGRKSIFVRCPKCGEEGTLRKRKKIYEIVHDNEGRWRACRFGWSSEQWEIFDRIYREVRMPWTIKKEVLEGVRA